MFFDYLKLAVNSLLKRRLRSWLTMIGIFIGIAAVVSLIGLGEGLRNAITSQFGALGGDMITIQAGGTQYGPPGTGVVTPLELGIEDDIEKIDGVQFAIPRLIKSGTMEYNDRLAIGMAGSIPDGVHRKEIENILSLKPYKGRLLKDGDRNKVVLGNNFKEDDIFGKAIEPGTKVLINEKQFEVVGIVKKSGNFFMDGVVMMNAAPLRELFDNTEEISILVAKVKKNVDMEKVKEDIEEFLRKERNVKEGEEDFSVDLAINTVETINSTLFAVQMFVYIIASISLLVGGIGIMNTMYTAVVERTKEIGIMKSIGAKNIDVFMIFLVESGLLGMVGGLIGVTVGVLLAKGMAAAGAAQLGSDLIQAQISLWLVVGALLFSFIIGCIAGITPAIRASKLHPVDALRYAK
ncbi:ABC transporter permease [Thermoproteota archaeon]